MTQGLHAEQPPTIQSVQRAAAMLSLFTVEKAELTLSDLTARMGMSKATVHRYATALREVGLLRQYRGSYTLGPRVVELGAVALASLAVARIAGPYLERLVQEVGETAVLSVWDGEAPVVVRVEANTGRLVQIVVATGSQLPPDSAQGQVFRAFLTPDAADPGLVEVRDRQMALDAAVVDGVAALAVPVFQGSEVVATMALVGTTASLEVEPGGRTLRMLRRSAENLTAELGFIRSNE